MINIEIDFPKLLSECTATDEVVEVYYLYLLHNGIWGHECLCIDEEIFEFRRLCVENLTDNVVCPLLLDLYPIYRDFFHLNLTHRNLIEDSDWEDDYKEKYKKKIKIWDDN